MKHRSFKAKNSWQYTDGALYAGVVELADTAALKAAALYERAGAEPVTRTIN